MNGISSILRSGYLNWRKCLKKHLSLVLLAFCCDREADEEEDAGSRESESDSDESDEDTEVRLLGNTDDQVSDDDTVVPRNENNPREIVK